MLLFVPSLSPGYLHLPLIRIEAFRVCSCLSLILFFDGYKLSFICPYLPWFALISPSFLPYFSFSSALFLPYFRLISASFLPYLSLISPFISPLVHPYFFPYLSLNLASIPYLSMICELGTIKANEGKIKEKQRTNSGNQGK